MNELIAIVDYNMGNLRSVEKSFSQYNCQVVVTNDHKIISKADKVVLPGVGSFKDGMRELQKLQLTDILNESIIRDKKPFLGICMGMQVLMDFSDENNGTQCLSVIKGKVEKLKSQKNNKIKIPHMGWNKIIKKNDHPIWHNIKDGSFFYFVHSYYINPLEKSTIIGETEYGKIFSSVIAKNNIIAIQGHPEQSSDVGLQFLKNFIRIN